VNVIPKLSCFSFPNPSLPILSRPVHQTARLLGLEEEDGAVAKVEVDEVFGFVGDEGSEVAAYDAVPGWAFALIELGGC